MYQVVPTIGTDGKKLLQLLPIPKSSGNLIPVVQSPVMAHGLKGNTEKPVQVTFQTQISSSSTSASVQLPIFQPASTTKYFLTGTVDTTEKDRVTSVGTGNFTPPISNFQNHGVKIHKLTRQTSTVPPSTQNDSSYFIVNTPNLPANVNSSVLPSGHHLKIPAYAEVKPVLASSLPHLVQQKILGTTSTTTSTSGTVEASQIPTVIYVPPVNSVKIIVTNKTQNVYPKPVTFNTPQIPPNVATETQLKGGQHPQTAPVNSVFQEYLRPGIPCLVRVKSSNIVASKGLNTFVGRKNLGDNTIDTSLLRTNSSSRTQSIFVPIKDNALLTFNGKVLLDKKGTYGPPSKIDQQNSVSSDIPLKDSSQGVSSSQVTEISKEILNSVLVKSKSLELKTKSLSNSQLPSMANLRAEKNEKVERPSFSGTNPHTMNQSTHCLKQIKTVFTNPDFPVGFRTGQNAPRKENLVQNVEKICSSFDAATVTSQQCIFRDQESQLAKSIRQSQSQSKAQKIWRVIGLQR